MDPRRDGPPYGPCLQHRHHGEIKRTGTTCMEIVVLCTKGSPYDAPDRRQRLERSFSFFDVGKKGYLTKYEFGKLAQEHNQSADSRIACARVAPYPMCCVECYCAWYLSAVLWWYHGTAHGTNWVVLWRHQLVDPTLTCEEDID
eukprot:401463-Rhodomonas_salina.4